MEQYSRQITFDSIPNFRDLGGYRGRHGHTVVWRRLFRSGELIRMSRHDSIRLNEEIRLHSVIDLRNRTEQQQQKIAILEEIGAKYYNVPFRPGPALSLQTEKELYPSCSNMGEVYLYRIRQKEFGQQVVEAMKIIAEPDNHPLVFHCGAGKDRTGILAAMVLSVLGVADDDIIEDYILTAPFMNEIRNRLNNDPETSEDIKDLPEFTWEAAPESMALFLSTIKREYGSVKGYLEAQGAASSLVRRLEMALLI